MALQFLPFIAAGAQLLKGAAGLQAGNANRKAAYEQAREERVASEAQARRIREGARRKIGSQAADLAGGGFMGASAGDTAMDLLRESEIEAALDVMELRRQGAYKSRALQREGDRARRRGRFALLEGVLGAGSSYLKMDSDWAQDRRAGGAGGDYG